MNNRTCIVTRESGLIDDMIRFVARPDGWIVPDLKRNLPGRGCWIKAERRYVDEAVYRKLFVHALKTKVTVSDGLGELVDRLLAKSALSSLALARKSGAVVLGSIKIDTAIRSGQVAMLLHAIEAAADGIRKLDQARHAVVSMGTADIIVLSLFTRDEMDLVFRNGNVIHAAVLEGMAATGFLKRARLLHEFRGINVMDADRITVNAAKEMQ